MSRFNPGDLALLVGGPHAGTAVVIERSVEYGDEIGGRQFLPKSGLQFAPFWLVSMEQGICVAPDRDLMPLRDPDTEQSTDKALEVG